MIPIINLRSSSRINNTKTTNFVSSSTYYIKTLRYTGTQNKHHHITFKNILSQKQISLHINNGTTFENLSNIRTGKF